MTQFLLTTWSGRLTDFRLITKTSSWTSKFTGQGFIHAFENDEGRSDQDDCNRFFNISSPPEWKITWILEAVSTWWAWTLYQIVLPVLLTLSQRSGERETAASFLLDTGLTGAPHFPLLCYNSVNSCCFAPRYSSFLSFFLSDSSDHHNSSYGNFSSPVYSPICVSLR